MTERELDMIQAAGFKKVRLDMLWSQVEKQPGVFDFRRYDAVVAALQKRGLHPMVILGLGNPLYSPDLTIQPAPVRQAFERYAKTVVQHYRGQGLIYELVNEPNHPFFWKPTPDPTAYMALANRLLPQLKAIDPHALIAAPSTAGAPLDFLEACFRQGLLNCVDGVTIHPYQSFQPGPVVNRSPEAFEKAYQDTVALVKRYAPPGKNIQVLLGEWGYSSANREVSEEKQADYLTRQALLGMMHKTPVNIWYDWKGSIQGCRDLPDNKEDNFGLVRANLTPKPAYAAMQTMKQALQGKQFKTREPAQSGDYILNFENPVNHEQTTAAWTTQAPHWVNLHHQPVLLGEKPVFHPDPFRTAQPTGLTGREAGGIII